MNKRITLIAFAIGRIGVLEFRRIFYSFSKTPKLPIAKANKRNHKEVTGRYR